jgi:hypothetical protein
LTLAARRCPIPVIVCSADVLDVLRHAAELQRADCVALSKPFELDALLALVHGLIDRPNAVPA